MGCSASRPDTLLFTKSNNNSPDEDPYSLEYSMVSNSPPVPRALSLPTPLVHHPPLRKGDTHHLVSLTSTAYGSLILIDNTKPPDLNHQQKNQSPVVHHHADPEDSLSPDSVINTWELMDGLDDDDDDFDLGKPNSLSSKSNTLISFKGTLEDCKPAVKPSLTKPLWKHLSEESLLSKLDPNVVSSYRRALSSRQLGGNNESSRSTTMSVGCSSSSPSCSSLSDSWYKVPSNTENRILLYFTSLRGIRKTYEDCCSVRMIFRGFRVPVDERDISMDSMYRSELQSLLGGKTICLPQVFIKGKHVGRVEEIK